MRDCIAISGLLITLLFPCLSSAQDRGAQADAELTSAYKGALARLNPTNQELLRQSEREWIKFSDKNEAIFGSLGREEILTQSVIDDEDYGDVYSRRDHLMAYFGGNPPSIISESAWRNSDAQLGAAYTECMRSLNDTDRLLLRDAERAWIIYRDADALAAGAPYSPADSPRVALSAKTHLTTIRIAQLYAISRTGHSGAGLAAQFNPSLSPTPSDTPDPKALSGWTERAKALTKLFIEKKDSAFFASPGASGNVPDLPSDMAEQASTLSRQIAELPHGDNISNEYSAIMLLAGWTDFTHQLKVGNVDQACATLRNALSQKPKIVTAEYVPLWQAAESWDAVCTKAAKDFNDHTTKAQSFEALGKASEAIKEYQAAFGVIENSSTADKIKKLQEQSLGL